MALPELRHPPPRTLRCKRCGASVHRFRTEIGQQVQVEATPISTLIDITAWADDGSVWEWNGPHVRWVPMGVLGRPQRTWRPVHREHECRFPVPTLSSMPDHR